jgi:hypothetical protein|tara:strand:+ start:668 stop:1216 length:549 start_codon:yes stop_codon:yes gene_type:complete
MAHYNTFKGGIQKGTVAFDEQSKAMDDNAKSAMNLAFVLLSAKYPMLSVEKKLQQCDIPGGIGSCAPDGGVWYYDGELIACFESKKQGDKGNAIERWFKNNFIVRAINPEATYVTFASGAGVIAGNPIHRILHIAHCGEYGTMNEVSAGVNNLHCKIEGFTVEEMVAIMVETVDKIMAEIYP